MRPLTIAALPALAILACGGDGDDSVNPDATVVESCLPFAGATFEPDLTAGTKVNVQATFADGLVWFTYNVLEPGSSRLDVAMVRVSCDGVTRSRTMVADGNGYNDTYAPLTQSGDRVLVAWAGDNGNPGDNLDTFTRVYSLDGTALGEPTKLATQFSGTPANVSDWMPAVAADDNGGFVVAGTRARNDIERFSTYVQRTSPDGVATGATFDPSVIAEVGHNFPTAAATTSGTLVAYINTPDVDDDSYRWTFLPSGSSAFSPTLPELLVAYPSAGAPPALAANGDVGYAVANTDSNGSADGGTLGLWLRRLPGGTEADAVEVTAGTTGNVSPAIATDGVADGAIAWYRIGANRQLWIAPFADDNGTVTVGAAVQVPTERDPVVGYRPALVHLQGRHYMVAWHESDNGEYHLMARIVEL